jgi:DNA-binding CsgD family transcriptional regulator
VEPGDPRRDAEAALFRARAHWAAGSPDEARELIDAGLALVGGTGLSVEAKLLAAAAEFPLWDWNAPVAVQCAGEAWELARRAGLDESRFRCLYGRALYIAGSRDCLGHLAAAIEQAKCDGGGEAECEAGAALAAANHTFGRPGPARRLARRMVGRARTLRLRGWELYFRYLSVFQGLAHRGAYEDAIEELSLLLQEPGLGPVRDEVVAYLALALADVGRDREAGALLDRSLPAAHSGWGRALLLYILAETHWTAGRAGEALAAADACVSTGCAPTLLVPWVAATRSWALVDTGGAPGRGARSVPLPLNAGADLAIQALQRFNDPARMLEAERLFMAAARHCAGLLLRSELRCLWAAGEAARRAGELERARERLLSVEERARAHGLIPLLGRIQKSLRDLGVRRAAPRASSAYGLTDREREMLALVGGGCTSAEIARRLGLSAGTVDSAVRSAMTKLNASTRIQAALLSAGETQPQQLSGTRPLIVVEPGSGVRAAAVEELSGAGWIVHEGWPSTRAVRSVSGQRVVFAGDVSGAEDAAAALVAAARGAGVVVELRAEPAVTEGFLEDLRHLGPVEHRRANAPIPATLLSPEQSRLLTLLADGRSIPEAASELYISRRTAERRLATARRMLGVRRTSEAVLLSQFSS